ncbi:solute carrier family 16 member 6b [Alosa sapidissima]|uniref:solute carrier family 16 member 6b n=1 Tax=Alosa sapidissima TaxID=34773 RepID=UPI001C0A0E73|nr:solute carrier family 16 member 6b [Alosa sapidissima]XP_041943025.1 solute carrier family 16 member 6b [Alosa sapidissima]XP_041943026.1 solute carrier family 16 member 6b [Alosa sapidissima]XP_041943027.1 solute carrier family 16 member 6b [Alosa sapidissima]
MMGMMSSVKGCMGPNVYPEVPDGGWGWVVAVAFFFVEVFTYGVIKSFGIFLQDLMGEFNETNSRVSWVVSICVFIMAFTAPLSTMMSNRFGYRPVVMVGGFLISLGTICSGFATSINEMYITVGIVSGLGYCMTFLPTITILSQYFGRRRSIVTSIASSGECVAVFALVPAFTAIKDVIGWRYCMVVIGVLQMSVIVCGALLRPIIIRPKQTDADSSSSPLKEPQGKYELENELTINSVDSGVQSLSSSRTNLNNSQGGASPDKNSLAEAEVEEQQACFNKEEEDEGYGKVAAEPSEPTDASATSKLLDFSVLRDGGFVCYSLFGLFATLGFFAPQLYVMELGVSRGMSRDAAPALLSTMAAAEIVGRLSVGWLLTRLPLRKINVLLLCTVLLAGVLVAFTLVLDFWGLAVCCALYGFLLGTVCSTHIPMLAEDDVLGIQRMPSAVGVYVCIQSFAGLAGPPLGGVLVDKTGNYGSAFYSCAVGMGLGALFLGLVRPLKLGMCQGRRKGQSAESSPSQSSTDDPVDFLDVDLAGEGSPTKSNDQSVV